MRSKRISNLTVAEKNMATYIENYVFPNERESILEALLFIEAKVSILNSQKTDKKDAYWAHMWVSKAKQLYRKASMMLRGEKAAGEAFKSILNHNKQIKKRLWKHKLVGVLLIITILNVMVFHPSIIRALNPRNAYYVWPKSGMGALLPIPIETRVTILENSENSFIAELKGQSSREFDEFVAECKKRGFTFEAKENEGVRLPNSSYKSADYVAYNKEGYWLILSELFSTEVYLFAPEKENEIYWEMLSLGKEVPQKVRDAGIVVEDTDEQLTVKWYNVTLSDFYQYKLDCKNGGYNLDTEEKNLTFVGYNSKGYKIETVYEAELQRLTVYVSAPMKMRNIVWPNSKIAKLLPIPSSLYGTIRYDRDDYFSVYIGDVAKEIYEKYVDDCISKGFKIKSYRYTNSYSAENKKGYDVHVSYEGGGVMYIEIDAPD